MYGIPQLRTAITDTVNGRANTRAAGAGLWAWYVRAAMYEESPKDVEEFGKRHDSIAEELNTVSPMTKQEKSSIASAKSIIKNAVQQGFDVWQREADGSIKKDEAGHPMPRGKSDLQDAKTPLEKLLKTLSNGEAIVNADDWVVGFTDAEKDAVTLKVRAILQACGVV